MAPLSAGSSHFDVECSHNSPFNRSFGQMSIRSTRSTDVCVKMVNIVVRGKNLDGDVLNWFIPIRFA